MLMRTCWPTVSQAAGAAGQQPAEDIGALDQHVAAVLDAYRKLGHDASGENS
jgi:hypothetical protein